MPRRYKPSFYNLAVQNGSETLLFNGVTSGLLRLPPELADALRPFLGPPRSRQAGVGRSQWAGPSFTRKELPAAVHDLLPDLLAGGFLIPETEDEFASLRERYREARRTDPFLVTITTTLDCNLGCYYCYEEKSPTYLSRETCDLIFDWMKNQIETRNHERVYTDWYGGEPMLNQAVIEYFSAKIIDYCESRKIPYSSSMISNGTLWPADAPAFVERCRIRHVQFTLDGLREHHNRRRRYVRSEDGQKSSFDEIVATIDRLLGSVRIYLRINLDPASAPDALELVEFFHRKGWLKPGAQLWPYLAMIGPMTDHCSSLGRSARIREFSTEFEELNHRFLMALSRYIDPRGLQHLQYYPATVEMNCAAVGANSVVFGPDGLMYKCGLDVGQTHLAHDHLHSTGAAPKDSDSPFRILNNRPASFSPHPWESFDPFTHERCSECQYLPICMGGCPKTQFEKNEFYLRDQSRYWEENIDTVLRNYAAIATRESVAS